MDASTWVGQPLAALDTPFLYVDLDCMERNIDKMAQLILQQAKVGWRPHTKAMKTPVLAQKLLAAGAHGITCHLRKDRRHVQDADIHRLREAVTTLLNLECSLDESMLAIAEKSGSLKGAPE